MNICERFPQTLRKWLSHTAGEQDAPKDALEAGNGARKAGGEVLRSVLSFSVCPAAAAEPEGKPGQKLL